MQTPRETEIKLRVSSAERAREALARLPATLTRARHHEDNVLYDDARSSLVRGGRTLRIRRTESASVLTYKGPREDREGVKSRPEVETIVADADATQAILEALGFRPAFRYQKYREVYRWKETEIVIDETPIGTFFEVEGPLDAIHAAAAALGYQPSDYVADSYAALFAQKGGRGDMVFGS